jgi:hypothetical protein
MPRHRSNSAASIVHQASNEKSEEEKSEIASKTVLKENDRGLSAPALHAVRELEPYSSRASSEPCVFPCESDHDDNMAGAPLKHESTFSRPFSDSNEEGKQSCHAPGAESQNANDCLRSEQCAATDPRHGSAPHAGASPPPTPPVHVVQLPSPPLPRTHFQYIHSFECRRRLAARMRALYGAESIPVIVEPAESHLRTSSSAAPPYESQRLAVESRLHGVGLERGLLARLGVQETYRRGSSTSAVHPPALSASAAAALSSPSTRSTLKCVLPSSKSVAEVIFTLRDRLALDSCQSIFLSAGESDALVPGNSLLGDLYQRYRHPDGFLYLSYLLENTFG